MKRQFQRDQIMRQSEARRLETLKKQKKEKKKDAIVYKV